MSYDLSFRTRTSDRPLQERELWAYFQKQPNFSVSEAQAVYSNETTGVYFVFDIGPEPEIEDEEPRLDGDLAPVVFNINYFRPHYFGLEAEPVLTAFVKHFDLLVSDPQTSGMGDGEYSPQGFLDGWNAGNEFGYKACLIDQSVSDLFTLPTAILNDIWTWNYTRDKRQADLGESVYIPRIFFFTYRGELQTGVAWPDAIPILLPQVGIIAAPRDELAPRRFFKKQKDLVFFDWGEVEPLVSSFEKEDSPLLAYSISYMNRPAELEKTFRRKKASAAKPQGIAPDQILNRELVEKHAPSRT